MVVRVRAPEKPPRPEIDVALLFVKRADLYAPGVQSVPTKGVVLDSRGVGWVPTALLLALLIATPLPWRHRWKGLLSGLVLVHGYLIASIGFYLWNQTEGLVPVTWIPFWPALGNFLEETFVGQIGPSFAVPVLIWLFVLFVLAGPPDFWRGAKPPPVARRKRLDARRA
jgi:hypothetical protein